MFMSSQRFMTFVMLNWICKLVDANILAQGSLILGSIEPLHEVPRAITNVYIQNRSVSLTCEFYSNKHLVYELQVTHYN